MEASQQQPKESPQALESLLPEVLSTLPSNLPSRDSAPFIFDIASRTLKSAAIGYVIGFVFFKRGSSRRFCTYYGAGIGLGISYSQFKYLYNKLYLREDLGEDRLDDLQKELKMREKVVWFINLIILICFLTMAVTLKKRLRRRKRNGSIAVHLKLEKLKVNHIKNTIWSLISMR